MSRIKFAIILCVFFTALTLPAATRVAIVSAHYGNLEDLMTARLSEIQDIELLERGEISKIIKEQKLNAELISPEALVSIGRILRTDLFIVVQKEMASKNPVGMLIFDAQTGVRLWDTALPEGKLEDHANFALEATKQAISKKDRAQEGELKYISLLSARNVNLPKDKTRRCETVGMLFLRQIGNSAHFAVLERKHLDWLNREREQPGMEWVSQLLGSNLLIELEISRSSGQGHEDGQVVCSLLLPEDKKLSVEGPLNNPALLANMLAKKFSESQNINIPPLQMDLNLEARRFYLESNKYREHNMRDEAAEKIAAAYALSPNERNIALAYLKSLSYLADENSNFYKIDYALDLIETALGLARQLFDKGNPMETMVDFSIFQSRIDLGHNRMLPLTTVKPNWKKNTWPLSQEQISRIKKVYAEWLQLKKKTLFDYYLKDSELLDKTRRFDRYTDYVYQFTRTSSILTCELWLDDCLPEIQLWLEKAAVFHAETGGEPPSASPLGYIASLVFCQPEFAVEHKARFREICSELKRHPSQLINAYSAYIELLLQVGEEFVKLNLTYYSINEPKCAEARAKIIKVIYPAYLDVCRSQLDKLPEGIPSQVIERYYRNMIDPLTFSDPMLEKVFDLMIERKEIHDFLVFHYLLPRWAEILEPIEFKHKFDLVCKLAESPACRMLPHEDTIMERLKTAGLQFSHLLRETQPQSTQKTLWHSTVALLDLRPSKGNHWESRLSILSYALSQDGKSCYVVVIGDKNKSKDPRLPENAVYLLKVSFDEASIGIVSKHLPTQEHVHTGHLPWNATKCFKGEIENNLYITPSSDGILVFPISDEKKVPLALGKKAGLPDVVHSLCVKDHKIYALGHDHSRSFLFSCDMADDFKVEVLDSSMKSENFLSPRASGELFYHPAEDKIIAVTQGMLAEFDLTARKWSTIIPEMRVHYSKRADADRLMLAGNDFCLLYDLKDNSKEVILSHGKYPPPPLKNIKSRLTFVNNKKTHTSPYAIGRSHLWTGNGFTCQSFENGELQELPHPMWAPSDGSFFYVRILEVVDNQRKILLGTDDGLFLINLTQNKDDKNEKK